MWRFLRAQGIDLAGRKSRCLYTDPEFAAKAADIVGLYLNPPHHAIVLAVDEKPAIQALERAQGYLKLPNGRALTGAAHEDKRRGTTTLFAALEVATGQIEAKHARHRRRAEFLDFMNEVIADYPDQEIHIVLDNLSTHKPKRNRWRARHENVSFHWPPHGVAARLRLTSTYYHKSVIREARPFGVDLGLAPVERGGGRVVGGDEGVGWPGAGAAPR